MERGPREGKFRLQRVTKIDVLKTEWDIPNLRRIGAFNGKPLRNRSPFVIDRSTVGDGASPPLLSNAVAFVGEPSKPRRNMRIHRYMGC